MTRARAKELLPIIQAFAEGKAIEWKTSVEKWVAADVPNFEADEASWRIRPEPRTWLVCPNCNRAHDYFGHIKEAHRAWCNNCQKTTTHLPAQEIVPC